MVKVRFAPSPTGKLHLGSARTAIFNWLYAKHTGGTFVLRIEDTDKERSLESHTQSILHDMQWMGMDYQEFYKQSERFSIYQKYIDQLISEGKAYYCTCNREDIVKRSKDKGLDEEITRYDGHCRNNTQKPSGEYVVRLNIGPDRYIAFKDVVKGKISVNTKELDDYVIWKSDNSPTYHFAVVVDDALMEMTHIIRGEDHITNTTKQIILYEYLNFKIPEFAHLPVVLDKDHSKLSKRKGSTNIDYYRAMGILPSALLNYIAKLGWAHGNEEIFTVERLCEVFSLEKISKSNAVYDEEKMIWLNGKHLKTTSAESLEPLFEAFLTEAKLEKTGKMQDKNWLTEALSVFKARSNTLKAVYDEMLLYAVPVFGDEDSKIEELIAGSPAIKTALSEAVALIKSFGLNPDKEKLEEGFKQIIEKNQVKFGDMVQPLRVKLTGRTVTPDIISTIRLLGEDGLKRL